MRILWVKNDFLHPTDRGGQIRTLETLRHLHRGNEIHYVAFHDRRQPEGPARASEYCYRSYPIDRQVPKRGSSAFFGQLISNFLLSDLPLAVGRYRSEPMMAKIRALLAELPFDIVVCDFLSVSPNIPDLSRAVLFQHNVETIIWRRHAEHADGVLRRLYFDLQARRMFETERRVCRTAAHIIAVSANDAARMKELFGIQNVSEIATGVDLHYFRRPDQTPKHHDLVFVGAMDWLPNVDGARFFVGEILPIIRKSRPDCSLVLAGRSPVSEILAFAQEDPRIQVTGTVADVRPYLWESAVSIVPLRIGGGTRLKIYEAMAAGTPVVSTPIGAEGLEVAPGVNISLAADPESFAAQCLALLDDAERSRSQASAALDLVASRFSWDQVGQDFENILKNLSCRS